MAGNESGRRLFEISNEPKVKLCFKAQDGNEVYYRIRAHAKLQKALANYSKENNLAHSDVRFLYDGRRVAPNKTPFELGMRDEDHIDVMIHQNGGGHGHDQTLN